MLSIAPGYDPRYLTRSVGRGAENYYLAAVAEHGEPPGRWWGAGAEALGFARDSEVEGAVMEPLYESFLDPRDPGFADASVPMEEKARLGRRKSKFKDWEEIYAKAAAAEPEASPERLNELRISAKQQARQAVIHHDATFSPAKSVTLVHAGLLAAALQAEQGGNAELAASYRKAAQVVEDGIMAGAEASLRYLAENAGEARVGYHGAKVGGRTTGRWMEAGDWVVARFLQHTNREGEPQLHVHQAILNRQLCADGKWRALDGMALYRARAGAAAVGERTMEEYLTRRLGLEFCSRADGQGREVVGVSPELITAFSTRRAQVTQELQERIDAYVAAHGRPPSARAIFVMAQHATKATKTAKPKAKDAPSREEELREWEAKTSAEEIQRLSGVPAATLGRIEPGTPAAQLAEDELRQVLEAAITDVQMSKAAWTRHDLTRAINRHLPDYLGGLPAERVEAVLADLTNLALDPSGNVRLLNAGDVIDIPEELRREDGTSIYQSPGAERYSTIDQIDAEIAFVRAALRTSGPRVEAEQAAELVGMTHEQARALRLAGEQVDEGRRLFEEQAAAVAGILTSGRTTDVLVGAAGTGKSFTVNRLAEAWRTQFGTPTLGLTVSQNAAEVLQAEGGLDEAMNVARWLIAVDNHEASVPIGGLVILDEASMATAEHAQRIQQLVSAAGAKLVMAGDDAQLAAPGAGGSMRHLVSVGGSHQLRQVVRFSAEWEREASLRLRDGLADVIATYDEYGRLVEGDREQMQETAYRAYLADHLAGRQSLLLAPTNEAASQLAGRVRAELVGLGLVQEQGVRLRDGNAAGIGDLIVARQNERQEEGEGYSVTNRDVLSVQAVLPNGAVLTRVVEDGRMGRVVELDAQYVGDHVDLAYAGTVHAAQGRTVYRCHAVVDGTVTRQMLYVMMTRGRDGNYAYVVTDRDRQADLRPGPEQAQEHTRRMLGEAVAGQEVTQDRFSVLNGVLEQDQADQTAVEAMLEEGGRPRNLAHLGSMWIDQIREGVADAYVNRAEQAGMLSAEEATRLRADEAKSALGRQLRQIEMSGRNADCILSEAIAERDFEGARSLAQVLHARIKKAAEKRGIDVDRLEVAEEQVGGTFRERTPDLGKPRIDKLLTDIADEMDVRKHVLGQEALETPPNWLIEEIGEPGDDVIERGLWASRAGEILGYREQYGHQAESDAIGPAPSRKNAEQRAAWFAAHDALGRPDASREIVGATDGELWVMRARYEREAKWAPPHVGDELRKVSIHAKDRATQAEILRARAAATEDPKKREALEHQAAGQQALADAAADRQRTLETIHQARQAWHKATEEARIQATRADAELRRREHIDADRLPRLHADGTERAQAPEPVGVGQEQIPGQLELDVSSSRSASREAAWQPQPQPTEPKTTKAQQALKWVQSQLDKLTRPEVVQERTAQSTVEVLRKQRTRLEWEVAQAERAQARAQQAKETEREHAAAAAARQPATGIDRIEEQRQAVEERAEQQREQRQEIPGQTALDVFTGLEPERRRVDREADPQLAEALERAQAAQAIAVVREAEQQREHGEAETERRRRESEREADRQRAEQQRAGERTTTERERVQEQAEQQREQSRAEAARLRSTTGRSPAELAAQSFPVSPAQTLRQGQERRGPEAAPRPPQAEPKGPELGM